MGFCSFFLLPFPLDALFILSVCYDWSSVLFSTFNLYPFLPIKGISLLSIFALQEMDENENNLRIELESAQPTLNTSQSRKSGDLVVESKTTIEAQADTDASKSSILDKLESKRKELVRCTIPLLLKFPFLFFFLSQFYSLYIYFLKTCLISQSSMEETVQDLEKKWSKVQDNALKQPSPGNFYFMSLECVSKLNLQLSIDGHKLSNLVYKNFFLLSLYSFSNIQTFHQYHVRYVGLYFFVQCRCFQKFTPGL